MSKQEQIHEPPRRREEDAERRAAAQSEHQGELSFDDLPLASPGRRDETPFVHKLQERAGAALDGPSADDAPDPDVETFERWPPRVQALCIVGGGALCWGLVLAPFLLF